MSSAKLKLLCLHGYLQVGDPRAADRRCRALRPHTHTDFARTLTQPCDSPCTPPASARAPQNAEIFKSRIGSLRKALKSRVEFVFIDAPFEAQVCGGAGRPHAASAHGTGQAPRRQL